MTWRDKNITMENWLRSPAVVISCPVLFIEMHRMHSIRFRILQIIVQISRARACLFNWIKIGTRCIHVALLNKQIDIPQNRQLRFCTRKTDWHFIPFSYWKIPCMLSRSGWRCTLICDFTIHDVVMPEAHYGIAVVNFISSGILRCAIILYSIFESNAWASAFSFIVHLSGRRNNNKEM